MFSLTCFSTSNGPFHGYDSLWNNPQEKVTWRCLRRRKCRTQAKESDFVKGWMDKYAVADALTAHRTQSNAKKNAAQWGIKKWRKQNSGTFGPHTQGQCFAFAQPFAFQRDLHEQSFTSPACFNTTFLSDIQVLCMQTLASTATSVPPSDTTWETLMSVFGCGDTVSGSVWSSSHCRDQNTFPAQTQP